METDRIDQEIKEISRTVLSYCMARTANQYEAEDLAQEILLALTTSLPSLRNEDAFYGFMWGVAGNIYRQWCRKRAVRNDHMITADPEEIFSTIIDVSAVEDQEEYQLLLRLRREMTLLSSKYRKATILYYMERKSCAEIAFSLGTSESMVKYLLFKSRKILKEGMCMERNYGEQSYHPKKLTMLFMGEKNTFSALVDKSTVRQNILWCCYHDKQKEEQIALQIGVGLPYIEDDIKALLEAGLLLQEGNYYRTNIIIETFEYPKALSEALVAITRQAADWLKEQIEPTLRAIREIGFYGADMPEISLRWLSVCYVLKKAFALTNEQLLISPPLTAMGTHAYVWGAEGGVKDIIKGGFNTSTMKGSNYDTDISLYFMDWLGDPPSSNHNDFFGNRQRIIVYGKMIRGILDRDNEVESMIAADLIRLGYAHHTKSGFASSMPVFTVDQYEAMDHLLSPTCQKLKHYFLQMRECVCRILAEYSPTHLKSSVEGIASISLWNNSVNAIAASLVSSRYLIPDWQPPYENATSFVVLE